MGYVKTEVGVGCNQKDIPSNAPGIQIAKKLGKDKTIDIGIIQNLQIIADLGKD